MKKLLISTTCLFLIAFQAPVYADKPCKGMDDDSFGCASWVASETFLELAGDKETQPLAAQACVDVMTDQLSKGETGTRRYSDGVNSVVISALPYNGKTVITCLGK